VDPEKRTAEGGEEQPEEARPEQGGAAGTAAGKPGEGASDGHHVAIRVEG
jgi:hypothetical protein